METILKIDNIEKYYGNKSSLTKAIDNISFEVGKGEFVSIMGASGSGKTTLLNCISTLDKVTTGKIYVGGNEITQLKGNKLNKFRREELGFIFQDFNLLDTLTAFENIALALSIQNVPAREIELRVRQTARELGIEDVLNKYPYQMSGGQKQRVAIAGILAMKPKCIVLDEPTAMLDPNGRKEVIATITKLNKEEHVTVILITHYMDEVIGADKVFVMDEGKVVLSGTPREVFSKVEHLKALRLDVPHTTELAFELEKSGIPMKRGILTIEEFTQELIKVAKHNHIDRRSTSC